MLHFVIGQHDHQVFTSFAVIANKKPLIIKVDKFLSKFFISLNTS